MNVRRSSFYSCRQVTPHILHIFPSFGVGGMPLRTARVINYLGARVRHTIISLDGTTSAVDNIAASSEVDVLTLEVDKKRVFSNLLNYRRVLVNLKPDLLTTYNWGAVEWACINRFWPICRHIHFEAGFHRDEATRQLWRRVVGRRLALKNSQTVIVPSRTLERIAIDVWRLPVDRVKYIPDGIQVTRFDRERDGRAINEAKVVIGTVAPLRAEKNLGRLIEAFSQISDDPRFSLVIAGDGPERSRLEELAAEKRLTERISFLGFVSHPEAVLAAFDIFALSSDTEQIPNAVLEAMAARLPIASVDVGDIREMVAPLNRRFVVARDDIESLADALRQLAADPELRARIGSENHDRVEARFAEDRMFAEYEKLLLDGAASTDRSL